MNCQCSYDFILDIPEFIKQRSNVIHEQKQNVLFVLKRVLLLINYVLENLPTAYNTRMGCEIEQHYNGDHSDCDSSRQIGALIIRELNELLINMTTGSYNSSIIIMRSMIEWLVRTVAIVSDCSILTSRNNDKNRAMCFNGLLNIMQSKKFMDDFQKEHGYSDEEIKKIKKYNGDSIHIIHLSRVFTSNVSSHGIGKIPKCLNSEIIKCLKINHPKSNEIIIGERAIYMIYDILSQHIHNTTNVLLKVKRDGETKFLDHDEFDTSFDVIMSALDLILTLYIILIDIDIYDRYKDDQIHWREFILNRYRESKFGKQTFVGCETMLQDKHWTKNPIIKFTVEEYNKPHV